MFIETLETRSMFSSVLYSENFTLNQDYSEWSDASAWYTHNGDPGLAYASLGGGGGNSPARLKLDNVPAGKLKITFTEVLRDNSFGPDKPYLVDVNNNEIGSGNHPYAWVETGRESLVDNYVGGGTYDIYSDARAYHVTTYINIDAYNSLYVIIPFSTMGYGSIDNVVITTEDVDPAATDDKHSRDEVGDEDYDDDSGDDAQDSEPSTCPPEATDFSTNPVRYADGALKLDFADLPEFADGSGGLTRSWSNLDVYKSNTGNLYGSSAVTGSDARVLGFNISIGALPYPGESVVPIGSLSDANTSNPLLSTLMGASTGSGNYWNTVEQKIAVRFDGRTVKYYRRILQLTTFADLKKINNPQYASGDYFSEDGREKLYYVPAGEPDPLNTGAMYTLFNGRDSSEKFDSKGRLIGKTNARSNKNQKNSYIGEQLSETLFSGANISGGDEKIAYDYSDGRLSAATLMRFDGSAWSTVRSVQYAYYGSGDEHGTEGDLKLAIILDANGQEIDRKLYRYYTTAGATGYVGGLKYVVDSKSYRRLIGAGVDPLAAGDSVIAPYADFYFEYDSNHRVTKETVQGEGCSACSGGQGTYTFAYSQRIASGPNTWKYKTVETLPDNSVRTVYCNDMQLPILKVFEDSGSSKTYITFRRYDNHGRVTVWAEPSAVSGYSEAYPDLVGFDLPNAPYLNDNEGLIIGRDFFPDSTNTNGVAGGKMKFRFIKHGEQGEAIDTLARTYVSGTTVNGFATTLIGSETVFRNDDGTGSQTITYSYSFDSQGRRVKKTTNLPVVGLSQHGPGVATQADEVFDDAGRLRWYRDQGGFITYTRYDAATGALLMSIDDVKTAALSSAMAAELPTGWATPLTGGLHLTTVSTIDGLGRTTTVVDPKLNVVAYVYNDAAHEIRKYPGWNSSTRTTTGPISVYRDDSFHGYTEGLEFSWSGTGSNGLPIDGNGNPSGAELLTLPQVKITSLGRNIENNSGQIIRKDLYIDLGNVIYSASTPTLGNSGTNYLSTGFGYDWLGRLARVIEPTGSITQTVFDSLGNTLGVWRGTSNTGWSQLDPSGSSSANNDMLKVASFEYDLGGNQTSSITYPHDGTADRKTLMFYDWRNRRIATKSGATSTATLGTLNTSVITYSVFDNLNEVIASYAFDADTLDIVDEAENNGLGDGVPDMPSPAYLRAFATAQYDVQGRLIEQKRFSVDPVTGNISTGSLDSNYWFDTRGHIIKSQATGQASVKSVYDGVGRVTAQFITDASSDNTWADAGNVQFDTVIEQTNTTYDAAGNVVLTLRKRRFHDAVNPTSATASYELGRPTSGIRARLYYTPYWYDAANRLVASAEIGTNFGTDYTRSNNPPARSDTKLVTNYFYDDAGRLSSTTDPKGIVNQTFYDLAGRTTKTIANVQDSLPSDADDQIVEYTYTGDGNILTQTARLPNNAFQTTQFVYGSTTARGDGINDNDVLIATQYPNPATGAASSSQQESYTTNALGERTTFTDRNGTTHTYSHDVLGRTTLDAVTTLGSGVDGAVRAIGMSYNTQGLPEKFTSYANANGTDVQNEVQRTYNGLGQVTAEYQSHYDRVNAVSLPPSVQYAYSSLDSGSRLATMTYPNGRSINYNYDGLDNTIGRLSSISDASGYLEGYQYLGMDTVVVRSHPQTGVNLSYVRAAGEPTADAGDQYTGLDRFNRVVNQKWVNASGTIIDQSTYTYDRDSNVATKANPLNTGLNEAYTYDGLNRLASVARNGTAHQSWSLDALGNSGSVTTDGTTTARTNNSQNQMTKAGDTKYGYDANGNQTAQGLAADFNHDGVVNFSDFLIIQANYDLSNKTWEQGDANGDGNVNFSDFLIYQSQNSLAAPATKYTYDAWNRMVSITTGNNGTKTTVAAYAFDAMNRRIKDGATEVYFDTAWQVVEEQDASGNTTASYAWSPVYIDAMVARDRDSDGDANHTLDERQYPTQDANWNVTSVTNASGAVQARYAYDAYGARQAMDPTTYTAVTDPTGFRQGFQGGTSEAALPNLILFRNRVYDTTTMRWLSTDPASYIDGMNLYAMVSSNPTKYSDPTGLYTWTGPTTTGTHEGITLIGYLDSPYRGDLNWLTNGVIWTDAPQGKANFLYFYIRDGIWQNDPFTRLLYGSEALYMQKLGLLATYDSQMGRNTHWHAMSQPGRKLTCKQLQQKMVDWVVQQYNRARSAANVPNESYELGKAIHTLQDSYSYAHTGRSNITLPSGRVIKGPIEMFQDYSLQNSDKHGVADNGANFNNGMGIMGAQEATRAFLELYNRGASEKELRAYLTDPAFGPLAISKNCQCGGTLPEYQK